MPRTQHATLEELHTAAQRLSDGHQLSPALAEALLRGTSIGGARPKAMLRDDPGGRQLIAKFEVSSDAFPVVKAEAVAMDLAARVGLHVARTELIECQGKSVLLVERFDRAVTAGGDVHRRMLVSALTLFGLDEMAGRYATYHGLADIVRARFTEPRATLRELFSRIVFNICVSNTDDHARNHAAFYRLDPRGIDLTLTPGYDICPQPRSGDSAEQALAIDRDGRRTRSLPTKPLPLPPHASAGRRRRRRWRRPRTLCWRPAASPTSTPCSPLSAAPVGRHDQRGVRREGAHRLAPE